MVVGAGIAGIQASLDLANSGYLVYLVEKNSAIGGVMAQLDKTFPTNDCAMCILSPRMLAIARDPGVEIRSLTRVLEVQGRAGGFQVLLARRPRYDVHGRVWLEPLHLLAQAVLPTGVRDGDPVRVRVEAVDRDHQVFHLGRAAEKRPAVQHVFAVVARELAGGVIVIAALASAIGLWSGSDRSAAGVAGGFVDAASN